MTFGFRNVTRASAHFNLHRNATVISCLLRVAVINRKTFYDAVEWDRKRFLKKVRAIIFDATGLCLAIIVKRSWPARLSSARWPPRAPPASRDITDLYLTNRRDEW